VQGKRAVKGGGAKRSRAFTLDGSFPLCYQEVVYMNTTGADRKLLALGIKTAKFTAEELEKLIAKFLEGMKNGRIQPDQKTYEDFMQPGGTPLVNAAPNDEREMEGLSEIARRNGVNVSLTRQQDTNNYYLCFQGKPSGIDKTLAEYQAYLQAMGHTREHSPLLAKLEQAKKQVAAYQVQDKSKSREQERTAGKEER